MNTTTENHAGSTTTTKPTKAAPRGRWLDCPDCKHSATGSYLGRIGCKRCGWSEGGSKDKRGGLLG